MMCIEWDNPPPVHVAWEHMDESLMTSMKVMIIHESNYICVIEIYPYGTFYHDPCCQLINLFLFIYYNFNYIVGREHVIIHVV